uniref:Protein mesh n=1 Tax=Panagrellus redivivus TaxID=6233 RepID=A0A7E4ZV42_PANRE
MAVAVGYTGLLSGTASVVWRRVTFCLDPIRQCVSDSPPVITSSTMGLTTVSPSAVLPRITFTRVTVGTVLLVAVVFLQTDYARAQVGQQIGNINTGQTGQINQNINTGQQAGNLYTGTGNNAYYGVNLVPFGPENGDLEVAPGFLTSGQTIDLYQYFPFYGGLYNYTTISVNGYMAFATVLDQGPTINVGLETDWPRVQDPAMIAPYLCKQQVTQDQIPGLKTGVYFRLVLRQSLFGSGTSNNIQTEGAYQPSGFFGQTVSQACPGTPGSYIRCDANSDYFLEEMMRWLQEGVAGASMFRADAAVVVTWYNTASAISGRSDITNNELATYQVIWMTDQTARLSYVILNYDKLGFDAADFRMNSRSGRCRALFNGGNHTGLVDVDPTQPFKETPKVLAQRSGVPSMVRGRYMFRVDDVVRPGGCSNKTGGTYPMLIYPNIVNTLGEMTIDINAICLDPSKTYILMIQQRQTARCTILNPSIARCYIPRIYDWGTKTVYFQPQAGFADDDRTFVGYVYFVPPTMDPMRLEIGNAYDWFKNPLPSTVMPLTWYPRNFTNPDIDPATQHVPLWDESLYNVQLGLYVVGYKEAKDAALKKFNPQYRVLCRMATYANRNQMEYRFRPQEEMINLNQVEQWYLNDWERMHELYSYRVGFLKLAPLRGNDMPNQSPQLLSGLVSSPISLHFLWTTNNPEFQTTTYSVADSEARQAFVVKKATEMCNDWYDEDGALYNFIRDTETNASCPCIETQARMDLGRFMPHPRCSQEFRDISCPEMIGAENCYMSAQNVYGSYSGRHDNGQDSQFGNRFQTHYGQVCCYSKEGYLQQTTYQPVVKIIEDMFYNPGFPMRAYEFGSSPYLGQFEVPGMSAYYNDYMPYFLCCKFSKFRCQMFYWRRPSSSCQTYQPPAVGTIMGGGAVETIDNSKFIFNEPGVFTLLYVPKTENNPEVRVQVRLERYPNRKVDFSLLGHYMSQADLVQPTNVTVVTGVAIEATGTDRVVVTARGDTRRFRYRTNIIVGNLLRYFDTLRIQRYNGILIYVNNVQRGQPEIYVVLEEAEIGMKITESYALDIDRLSNYQESMGLLDVRLSVPPRYGVRPDGDNTRDQDIRIRYNLPRVSGLIRPFPDTTTGSLNEALSLADVNNEQYRQQIIQQYLIQGTGEPGRSYQQYGGQNNQNMPNDNMFLTSTDADKAFEVFPEVAMKNNPIYTVAPKYEQGVYRFQPKTGADIVQLLQMCRDLQLNQNIGMQPLQSQLTFQLGSLMCPDNPAMIISVCGDSVPCLNDYTLFNSEVLGQQIQDNWNSFTSDRAMEIRQYNSCGAINIEYPEYLTKTPAFSSGYLQGDVVRFGCFQTHWIHGDYEYKCSIQVDYNDPNRYRFEWNKGNQPWCRAKEIENYLTWLTAIASSLAIIMSVVLIFLSCWCIKQRRLREMGMSKMPRPRSASPQFAQANEAYEADINGNHKPFSQSSRASSPVNELRARGGGNQQQPQIAATNNSSFMGLNTSV